MNDEAIDAIIVRVQLELQWRLYERGNLEPADVIATWVAEKSNQYPRLKHVFLSTAAGCNQTLLMQSNSRDGISVTGNSGPVNLQVVSGDKNEVAGIAPLPALPEKPHEQVASGAALSWLTPVIVFIVATIIALMWFIDFPQAIRGPLSIGVAAAAIVLVSLRYLAFMRKTWEKHWFFGLASLLLLDITVRAWGGEFIAKITAAENGPQWLMEVKALIGEPQSAWVVACKIIAAVVLAGFALRAKILSI
jgi:hypothetical protein